jgi:hypothetical protein
MIFTAQEQWSAVGRYITDLLVPSDDALDAALAALVPCIRNPGRNTGGW